MVESQENFDAEGPRLMMGREEWRREDVVLAERLRCVHLHLHLHLY